MAHDERAQSDRAGPDQSKRATTGHPVQDAIAQRWSPYGFAPRELPAAELRCTAKIRYRQRDGIDIRHPSEDSRKIHALVAEVDIRRFRAQLGAPPQRLMWPAWLRATSSATKNRQLWPRRVRPG